MTRRRTCYFPGETVRLRVSDFRDLAERLRQLCTDAGEDLPREALEAVHRDLAANHTHTLARWGPQSIRIIVTAGVLYCRTPADDTARPGSCTAGCRYYQDGDCRHPERETHWRVPMRAQCFWHNREPDAPRDTPAKARQIPLGGALRLLL